MPRLLAYATLYVDALLLLIRCRRHCLRHSRITRSRRRRRHADVAAAFFHSVTCLHAAIAAAAADAATTIVYHPHHYHAAIPAFSISMLLRYFRFCRRRCPPPLADTLRRYATDTPLLRYAAFHFHYCRHHCRHTHATVTSLRQRHTLMPR